MQRIVDESLRRGLLATHFVAGAVFAALVSACGSDNTTAPRALTEPPVAATQLGLSSAFDPYIFLVPTTDDAGANDDPDQSDLNSFTRADNVTSRLGGGGKARGQEPGGGDEATEGESALHLELLGLS